MMTKSIVMLAMLVLPVPARLLDEARSTSAPAGTKNQMKRETKTTPSGEMGVSNLRGGIPGSGNAETLRFDSFLEIRSHDEYEPGVHLCGESD
jgi:hypothetical protein